MMVDVAPGLLINIVPLSMVNLEIGVVVPMPTNGPVARFPEP